MPEVGGVHEGRVKALSREERRLARTSLARSLLYATVITVLYFVLPLQARSAGGILALASGLAVVLVVTAWEIRKIMRSRYPGLQAVRTLALSAPLFIVAFAATYFIMSDADPSAFSEPLSKLDAVYFTVTIFATVGFGDITAKTEVARGVTIVQMLAGLILVGLIARVIVGAVQENRSRRRTQAND